MIFGCLMEIPYLLITLFKYFVQDLIIFFSEFTTVKKPEILHTPESQEYYFHEGCHILELSNSPADATVSIARARVEPGQTTRRHRLRDTTERYVILQGTGLVEAGDLPAQTVSTGDVVIIPPMQHQRIKNTGTNDLTFLAICTPRFRPACYEDTETE